MNTKLFYYLAIVSVLMLNACGNSNKLSPAFHMEKKYWDYKDYDAAIHTIKFTPKEEKLPCYADPEKAPVFRKMMDINNLSVVLEDSTLGLNYRKEFSDAMFENFKDMCDEYSGMDERDKYRYPLELMDIQKFGLYLQMLYFKIGNDHIIKEATDPQSGEVQNTLNSNIRSLVNNFIIYVELVNHEDALNDDALKSYAGGLDTYFPKLISKYPSANYSGMLTSIDLMLKKVKNVQAKNALNNIKDILNKKSEKESGNKTDKK